MLTDFDYARAEVYFATRRDPLLVRLSGSMRVVGSMLYNPPFDAGEDDLSQFANEDSASRAPRARREQ